MATTYTDTQVNNLVINKLTKQEYQSIQSPSETELYIVPETLDSVVTENSTNPVTSGAVYTAIQQAQPQQAQSDWNQSNSTAVDYIKNKPDLSSYIKPETDSQTQETSVNIPNNTNVSGGITATSSISTSSRVVAQDFTINDPNYSATPVSVQSKLDEINGKADETTSFTEASTRTNIASGDTVTTIWGKIKKWFSDLKTVAFTGSYNDLTDKPNHFKQEDLTTYSGNADEIVQHIGSNSSGYVNGYIYKSIVTQVSNYSYVVDENNYGITAGVYVLDTNATPIYAMKETYYRYVDNVQTHEIFYGGMYWRLVEVGDYIWNDNNDVYTIASITSEQGSPYPVITLNNGYIIVRSSSVQKTANVFKNGNLVIYSDQGINSVSNSLVGNETRYDSNNNQTIVSLLPVGHQFGNAEYYSDSTSVRRWNCINVQPQQLSVENSKVKYTLSDRTTKLTLAQESDLKSVAFSGSFYDLSDRIIGGRNLLQNVKDTYNPNLNSYSTLTLTTTEYITITATQTGQFNQVTLLVSKFPTECTTDIIVSWRKLTSSNTNAETKLYLFENAVSIKSIVISDKNFDYLTNVTFNPSNTYGLLMRIDQKKSAAVGDTLTIEGLKIQAVSRGFEWTPAPEDLTRNL